jgi:hypothetical protein
VHALCKAFPVFYLDPYTEERQHDAGKKRCVPYKQGAAKRRARGQDREEASKEDVQNDEGDDPHPLEQDPHRVRRIERIERSEENPDNPLLPFPMILDSCRCAEWEYQNISKE